MKPAKLRVEDVPPPVREPVVLSPDGAVPTGPMRLAAPVRTSKGYALAIAEIAPDGTVLKVKLGHSQTALEFIAREHKRVLGVL